MAQAAIDNDVRFEYSSSWPSEVRSLSGEGSSTRNERINPFNDSESPEDPSVSVGYHRDCQSLNGDARTFSFNNGDSRFYHASDDSLLSESHFEEPLAFINRKSSLDEIEAAVRECKRMFLGEIDDPVRKQRILKRLIELRQDLHSRKEEKRNPRRGNASLQRVLGHQLDTTISPRWWSKCEVCRGSVRGHRYLYCQECPVVCHVKNCRDQMTRHCPAVAWLDIEETLINGRSRSQSRCDTQLALDKAFLAGNLSGQDFLCAECRTPLCGKEEPDVTSLRVCQYTHKFYCSRCHWEDTWYMPGAVFLLNDTKKHPICRSAFLKLYTLWNRAIFRVPDYWNSNHPKARAAFSLRLSLCKMQPYFTLCPEACKIKTNIDKTEGFHIQEQPFSLKMKNVMNILDGSLLQMLNKYFDECNTHIHNCNLCLVRNTVCHVCCAGDPLFTYDPEVAYCTACSKYFHSSCSTSSVGAERTTVCPSCEVKLTTITTKKI